eukprot:gene11188-biopygen21378
MAVPRFRGWSVKLLPEAVLRARGLHPAAVSPQKAGGTTADADRTRAGRGPHDRIYYTSFLPSGRRPRRGLHLGPAASAELPAASREMVIHKGRWCTHLVWPAHPARSSRPAWPGQTQPAGPKMTKNEGLPPWC